MKETKGIQVNHDMFFDHNYARSSTRLRIVYIEYCGRNVHSVTAEHHGIQHHFDFELDCKGIEKYMFYYSGSGGKMTQLFGHTIVKGADMSYWIHTDARFKNKPKNFPRRFKPVKYRKSANPFDNGREIYGQDYCKFCKKWYDQDACPEHHIVSNEGELEYFDGSEIDQ